MRASSKDRSWLYIILIWVCIIALCFSCKKEPKYDSLVHFNLIDADNETVRIYDNTDFRQYYHAKPGDTWELPATVGHQYSITVTNNRPVTIVYKGVKRAEGNGVAKFTLQ